MWAVSKRVLLFVVVNILIFTTLNISFTIITKYLGYEDFGQYQYMLVWATMLGMGGSFVSLLLSKTIAKYAMRVQIIDPNNASPSEKQLLNRVYDFATRAGLKTMPEVGIYESPEVNAFATGPSKSNSLVACSSGILTAMNDDELDGVLAHEVAHIANGDMVTMTLLQGIINTLVFFIARVAAKAIVSNSDNRGAGSYFMISIGLQIVLSLLGSIVVNAFSRWREYRADAGSARIAGADKMIKALRRLQNNYDRIDTSHESMATFKISSRPASLMSKLFSTHPSLESRIQRLDQGRY